MARGTFPNTVPNNNNFTAEQWPCSKATLASLTSGHSPILLTNSPGSLSHLSCWFENLLCCCQWCQTVERKQAASRRRQDQSVVVRQVAPAQLLQLLHLPFLTKPLHSTTCLLSRRLLQTRPPHLNAGGNLALTLIFLVEHH